MGRGEAFVVAALACSYLRLLLHSGDVLGGGRPGLTKSPMARSRARCRRHSCRRRCRALAPAAPSDWHLFAECRP